MIPTNRVRWVGPVSLRAVIAAIEVFDVHHFDSKVRVLRMNTATRYDFAEWMRGHPEWAHLVPDGGRLDHVLGLPIFEDENLVEGEWIAEVAP